MELCSEEFILYWNSLYKNTDRRMDRGKSGQVTPENGVSKGPQNEMLLRNVEK